MNHVFKNVGKTSVDIKNNGGANGTMGPSIIPGCDAGTPSIGGLGGSYGKEPGKSAGGVGGQGGWSGRNVYTYTDKNGRPYEKIYETKDSGKREEYSTGMKRDTQEGKPRYDLLITANGFTLLTRWAELMARGADKYGERNWEKAQTEEEMERFKASAFRHFMQWMKGEADEDHASAVLFNIQAYEYVKEEQKKLLK